VIAAHYLDAYEAARDDADAGKLRAQALDTLRRAARRSETVGAPEAAERAYRTAIELADDDAERLRLTEAAGDMALRAARYEESIELFQAVRTSLNKAGREREAARLAAPIGRAVGYLGRNDEAIALMEDALTLLGPDEIDPAVAEINATLASVLTFSGEIEKAKDPLERALQGASALGRPEILCEALINRGIHCNFTGRHEEGLVLFEGAIKIAGLHNLTRLRVRAELNAADQSLRAGLPDMVDRSRNSLRLTRQLGDRGQEAVATGNVMLALLLTGEWDEVEELGRSADYSLPDNEFLLNRLASLRAMRGEVELARRTQSQTEAWASTLAYEARMLQHATEGMVTLVEGRPADAFERLSSMIQEALSVEGPNSEGLRMGWPDAIDAAVEIGKLDEAAELCRLVEERPPGHVGPYLRAQIARARALIAAARGEREGAEQGLLEAVDNFRALGYPYWLARAQTDLAAWLIDAGRGAEAAPLLEDAIAVFEELRAAPALARAVELQTGQPAAQALGA
jgi:tetratricopeptide (TPR) repeat protein